MMPLARVSAANRAARGASTFQSWHFSWAEGAGPATDGPSTIANEIHSVDATKCACGAIDREPLHQQIVDRQDLGDDGVLILRLDRTELEARVAVPGKDALEHGACRSTVIPSAGGP